MGREDFEGLLGQYRRANRFRSDYADFNEEGGMGAKSIPYDMIEDARERPDDVYVWFDAEYTSGSDYSGGLVTRANYEVLLEEAERLTEDELGGDDSWFQTFYGGHGTYAIAFHVDKTPQEIIEMLAGLSDYPLIDDNKLADLEHEATEESWNNSYERDYRKALEDKFGGDADDVDDKVLREHFEEARERANEYWENEEGPSMHVDVDAVIKAVEEPPEGMVVPTFFRVEYYRTDEDDFTHTEEWFVQAPDASAARAIFIGLVKGGDQSVWDTSYAMMGAPEDSGDDTWYVSVDDSEVATDEDDPESWEYPIVMIKVGKATEVDEEEVDEDRLTEE